MGDFKTADEMRKLPKNPPYGPELRARWGLFADAGGGIIVGYESRGGHGEDIPVAILAHTNRHLPDDEVVPVLDAQIQMRARELEKLRRWRQDRFGTRGES